MKTYKTNKQKLIDLGLPDKIGIMLEGLPGTGKTSTVIAVATLMKKDIYYVHLDTVTTNAELTEIFQFVNNASNGGIVVFEDIDVMTDVVHSRTDDTSNSELTLGHILNILQGTLTKDGTVFIVTTNRIEVIDSAFCRAGRFDLVIRMQNADHYQCNEIYKNFFGKNMSEGVLKLLPEDTFTPAKFIFYLVQYIWDASVDEEKLIQNFVLTLK